MPQNGIASSVGLLVRGIESIYSGAELDWGIATFSGPQASSSSSTGLPLQYRELLCWGGFISITAPPSASSCPCTPASRREYVYPHTLILSPGEDCHCLVHCATVIFGGGDATWFSVVLAQLQSWGGYVHLDLRDFSAFLPLLPVTSCTPVPPVGALSGLYPSLVMSTAGPQVILFCST